MKGVQLGVSSRTTRGVLKECKTRDIFMKGVQLGGVFTKGVQLGVSSMNVKLGISS